MDVPESVKLGATLVLKMSYRSYPDQLALSSRSFQIQTPTTMISPFSVEMRPGQLQGKPGNLAG